MALKAHRNMRSGAQQRSCHLAAPLRPAVPMRNAIISNVLPEAGASSTTETAVYAGLGLAAASFVGTFGVAPRFKQYFKEPTDWRDMYAALVEKGVKTVTPEEAAARVKKGAVLLDVRLADKFASLSAARSVNIPLYRPIQNWDLASNIRRAGFAFFGIFGTELNEAFAEEVQAQIAKGKDVIVMCEQGGTIENKPGTQFGFQSRSLKAVYYLQQAGYGKVYHMKGGFGDWVRAGLPTRDEEDDGDDGGELVAEPAGALVTAFFGRR